jgi:predicted O-methyltransferase YrrM
MVMNTLTRDIYDGIQPSGNVQVDGWNSTSPAFARLIATVRPTTIIEVGTWLGASAIHMAKECEALELLPRIYCVDTWLGAVDFWTTHADARDRDTRQRNGYPQVYFDFLANVVQHGLQHAIIPIPNTSAIGAKILRYHEITADLIYIDGSHDFEDVVADIRNYRPLLRPGGIMFGDDLAWPDVARAVALRIGQVETDGPFWIWKP